MLANEFSRIVPLLKMYPGCCHDMDNTKAWFESLRSYSAKTVEDAVRQYISKSGFPPTPYNIIECMPKPKPIEKVVPRLETVTTISNGVPKEIKVRVYHCQRCKDSGLLTRTDNDGCVYGYPCDCISGHANYSWGWISRGEQQEYVNKNGHHGEIIGESWERKA